VEPLEVVEQIRPRLVASPILAVVHAFPLELSKEAVAGFSPISSSTVVPRDLAMNGIEETGMRRRPLS
jgi:hypothetical protein